jgi:hypothetical protein
VGKEEKIWRRAVAVRICAFERACAIGPRRFDEYMKALATYDRARRLCGWASLRFFGKCRNEA